jgi:hypothetical protein
MRQNSAHSLDGKLEVMETGMLRPKKSLLGVLGITRNLEKARKFARLIPCENCSLSACDYRRGPYKHARTQMEDVRFLQAKSSDALGEKPFNKPVLNHTQKYSINANALRKWSEERLQLKVLNDNSIEARFNYEGTTCSNMGRPLEFYYLVMLAPPGEDYRITKTSCAPSPNDTGHAYQCEYLKDANAFMLGIASEQPLLGRKLEDVFNWERAYNPSGCFCDADRRYHKWGLVFEVIHYALVQGEKEAANGHAAANLK